ncbi:pectin acetylesterase [Aureococcus anophagefferens]|nr:pectin acetylesterase [Aureococcus anophagefferens]
MASPTLRLATLFAAAQGQQNGPRSLGYELCFVDTEAHPLAVCNDGSPAAYYYYKGSSDAWIVHQQGGWWCWDAYSCQVRWDHFANHTTEKRTLMSTKDLQNLTDAFDTFNGEHNTGLMAHAPTNPMANASKVFLVYCSSDSHAGNRSMGSDGAGESRWHFRGKEIVAAVLAELRSEGLDGASHFLLTGGSAGGMATINNGDWVADRAAAPGARYLAMPDSGFFLDVQPGAMCQSPDSYECKCAAGSAASAPDGFNAGDGHAWLGRGQTLAQQMQAMHVYTNGAPDASCAAFYGRWGAWRCFLGQYAGPHLTAPTLFLQNQIDEWQGFWNGFFDYATDAGAFEYMAWFREESARTLEAAAGDDVYVFSPNCYHHGLAYDDIFWQVTVDEWTSASMMEAILFGGARRRGSSSTAPASRARRRPAATTTACPWRRRRRPHARRPARRPLGRGAPGGRVRAALRRRRRVPRDVPPGSTATPACAITDGAGVKLCALECASGDCPAGASCDRVAGAGICAYAE